MFGKLCAFCGKNKVGGLTFKHNDGTDLEPMCRHCYIEIKCGLGDFRKNMQALGTIAKVPGGNKKAKSSLEKLKLMASEEIGHQKSGDRYISSNDAEKLIKELGRKKSSPVIKYLKKIWQSHNWDAHVQSAVYDILLVNGFEDWMINNKPQ